MFKRKLLTVLVATAAVGFGGFATNASAASISGNATAEIYTPLSIAENTVMDFAGIAPSAVGGTLSLGSGGAYGPVPLGFFLTGTPAAGQFTVTGEGGLTYGITFTAGTLVHTVDATETMTVNAFTTSIASPSTLPGILGSAPGTTQSFTVGADLTVGGGQLAGTYNGTYTVTVNYQ